MNGPPSLPLARHDYSSVNDMKHAFLSAMRESRSEDSEDDDNEVFVPIATSRAETPGKSVEGWYNESEQLARVFCDTICLQKAKIPGAPITSTNLSAYQLLPQTTLMLAEAKTFWPGQEAQLKKIQEESRKIIEMELEEFPKRLAKVAITKNRKMEELEDEALFLKLQLLNGKTCEILKNCIVQDGIMTGEPMGQGLFVFHKVPHFRILNGTAGGALWGHWTIEAKHVRSGRFIVQEVTGKDGDGGKEVAITESC